LSAVDFVLIAANTC